MRGYDTTSELYGGCTDTNQGMSAMSVCEGLECAKACAENEYPPTNPNVHARAIYALQCALNFDRPSGQAKVIRAGIGVIAAWMCVQAGHEHALSVHMDAIIDWAEACGELTA